MRADPDLTPLEVWFERALEAPAADRDGIVRSAPKALRGVLQELLASVGAGAAALESPRWAVVDAGRLDDLLARPE